jgi:membrane protein implicated in regulation of membrane protease activity
VITISAQIAWGVAGLLLLAGELVTPGVFLMWIGLAALGVAGLTWVFEIGLQVQILAFAALALIAGLVGWQVQRDRHRRPGAPEAEAVNDTFTLMIDRTGFITEPIVGGQGKAKIGDSPWLVEGPDMPAGTAVRVVGQDGVLLRVEAI